MPHLLQNVKINRKIVTKTRTHFVSLWTCVCFLPCFNVITFFLINYSFAIRFIMKYKANIWWSRISTAQNEKLRPFCKQYILKFRSVVVFGFILGRLGVRCINCIHHFLINSFRKWKTLDIACSTRINFSDKECGTFLCENCAKRETLAQNALSLHHNVYFNLLVVIVVFVL